MNQLLNNFPGQGAFRISAFIAFFIFISVNPGFSQTCVQPQNGPADSSLQVILNSGQDLVLCKGAVYEIHRDSLRMTRHGQAIYTLDATSISEYAIMRSMNKEQLVIVNGEGLNNVRLENIIFDGNRYNIGSTTFYEGEKALMMFGVGSNQMIRNNIFMSTRSWSTLKLHENDTLCGGSIVENNIFLGAGMGARGNGLENNDPGGQRHWGDAISMGCKETIVRNNLFLDHTDVAVAIFSAVGSIVENNVATSVSREALGGFNLVDPLEMYALGNNRYDYRNTTIRNNTIDAFGARIHIGIPMGGKPWAPKNDFATFVGAVVTDNLMTGDAFGYGLVMQGLEDFTVTGNTSEAVHQGKVGNNPNPGPFLITSSTVSGGTIQPEFQTVNDMSFLLRINGDMNGNYYAGAYEDQEATAIVRAAYMEMLGRLPSASEATEKENWLKSNSDRISDQLRMDLMSTQDFKTANPDWASVSVDKNNMQKYRIDKWLKILDPLVSASVGLSGDWAPSKHLYASLQAEMAQTQHVGIVQPTGIEDWLTGSTVPISWTSVGDPGTIKLEYKADDGAWTAIASSLPDSGKHLWALPAGVSGNFVIRITAEGNAEVTSESNMFVVSPTGTTPAAYNKNLPISFVLKILGQKPIETSEKEIISYSVFNIEGKTMVKVPVSGTEAYWNGLNAKGQKLSRGLYFVCLKSALGTTHNVKIMMH